MEALKERFLREGLEPDTRYWHRTTNLALKVDLESSYVDPCDGSLQIVLALLDGRHYCRATVEECKRWLVVA